MVFLILDSQAKYDCVMELFGLPFATMPHYQNCECCRGAVEAGGIYYVMSQRADVFISYFYYMSMGFTFYFNPD